MSVDQKIAENLMSISWHDSAWIPILNEHNVMDYFSDRSNPFYDRTCNNEIVKMQRLSLDQLSTMQGTEYILLHVQEPILYVIRKQQRHTPQSATPMSDYYIIAGIVYQAPDLASVTSSRILSCVSHLQNAFEETRSFYRYHSSKGYWWDFGEKDNTEKLKELKKKKDKAKEEPSSGFQRHRVDMLLSQLTTKFQPKTVGHHPGQSAAIVATTQQSEVKPSVEIKSEIKTEQTKPVSASTTVAESETTVTNGISTSTSQIMNGTTTGIKREASSSQLKQPEKKPKLS